MQLVHIQRDAQSAQEIVTLRVSPSSVQGSPQEIVTLRASPSSVQGSAQEIVTLRASPSGVQGSAQEIVVGVQLGNSGKLPSFLL